MEPKIEIIEKSFEDFERKIERLEELELELKELNAHGVRKEVKEIKAELKNTDKIPFIELKLKELKEKIAERERSTKEKRGTLLRAFLALWKTRKKEKLTQAQIDEIESKVKESFYKHPLAEDALNEAVTKTNIAPLQNARIKEIQEKILGREKEELDEMIAANPAEKPVQNTKEEIGKPFIAKTIKSTIDGIGRKQEMLPAGKKEMIFKLKNIFRFDNILGNIRVMPKKDYSKDIEALKKQGFEVKEKRGVEPMYVIPKSNNKHSIINHFKEVYKYG